jgi:hypothetical protein
VESGEDQVQDTSLMAKTVEFLSIQDDGFVAFGFDEFVEIELLSFGDVLAAAPRFRPCVLCIRSLPTSELSGRPVGRVRPLFLRFFVFRKELYPVRTVTGDRGAGSVDDLEPAATCGFDDGYDALPGDPVVDLPHVFPEVVVPDVERYERRFLERDIPVEVDILMVLLEAGLPRERGALLVAGVEVD